MSETQLQDEQAPEVTEEPEAVVDEATALSNKGLEAVAERDFDLALTLHQQALELRRAEFGERHADTADSLNSLAMVHSLKGELVQALDYHRQVLDILKEVHGEEHPDTVSAMRNCAEVLMRSGESAEALELSQKAWELRTEAFGPLDPKTLQAFRTYIHSLRKTGQHREAFQKLSSMLKDMPSGTEDFVEFEEAAAQLWKKAKKPGQPASYIQILKNQWRKKAIK